MPSLPPVQSGAAYLLPRDALEAATMSGRRWTVKEDEIVRTYPTKAAAYLLRHGRTMGAVRDRRRQFGAAMAPACWVSRRWTVAEDEILRSNSIGAAIDLLKGTRTEIAVRLRRVAIGAAIPKNHWTKIEDRRIWRTAHLPLAKVVRLFKNRTATAIGGRRHELGSQRKLGPINPWKGTEIKLLRQMWPCCKISDIVDAIPRHRIEGIRSKAAHLGLHKVSAYQGPDVLDQIKGRAYEDGISLIRLAAELGCGKSFLRCRPHSRRDFNKIAAAVAFFGGRLVVDWCDE
jgi:hypothetical protein